MSACHVKFRFDAMLCSNLGNENSDAVPYLMFTRATRSPPLL